MGVLNTKASANHFTTGPDHGQCSFLECPLGQQGYKAKPGLLPRTVFHALFYHTAVF